MRHGYLRTDKLKNTNWSIVFWIVITCYSLLISSCGWRLRGSIDFPPSIETLFVQGTARYSDLGNAIYNAFDGTNSKLVKQPGEAKAVLHILSNNAAKRVLATDSSGRASEYEIAYLLKFKVVDNKGKELVREQQVTLKREYQFDPLNVLASGSEVARLQKEMVRDSVQQMLRRINAGLRNPEQAGKSD